MHQGEYHFSLSTILSLLGVIINLFAAIISLSESALFSIISCNLILFPLIF